MHRKKRRLRTKWGEATDNIHRARMLLERYDVLKVHPDELNEPNPQQEEWNDLLNRID